MTIAETDTEPTTSNGVTNGEHINTEPIDISWEEVGPEEEPESRWNPRPGKRSIGASAAGSPTP